MQINELTKTISFFFFIEVTQKIQTVKNSFILIIKRIIEFQTEKKINK